MTSYELMIKANHYLIKGGKLSNGQISTIVNQFISDRSSAERAQRYDISVGFPNSSDENGRGMYPIFYIPPYNNGKKLKTVLGQTPKTQILSANMYELEILRLLHIFALENAEVKNMVTETLQRLKTTCFGYTDDGVGECFDASLVVLRFLAAAAQQETEWIKSRIDNYNCHYGDKKRPWFSKWYYWLCLSELPFAIAYPEIEKYKDEMLHRLTCKSYVMNSENDKKIHPVCLCILRNALSKYPEYAYIKERQPYINAKDGRLYFDMRVMENSYRFFANRDCEYFPCHKVVGDFNCLFCYCPLYLKENCPGKPAYIEKDGKKIKDCTNCIFPHQPENYDAVIRILGE